MVDVGWGDSVLIESEDHNGQTHYALVDSNEEYDGPSSLIFLRKFFEKQGITPGPGHLFDFILLSHGHTDHGKGLETIFRRYGAERFWYPKSADNSSQANLLRAAKNSSRIRYFQAIDRTKVLPNLGDAQLGVLWPPHNVTFSNPNNNSVVLTLTLGNVTFLLTGDAERLVWDRIGAEIPQDTRFVKVPHHGAWDATVINGQTPWLDHCPAAATLGISCHVQPHPHPSRQVIDEFNQRHYTYYRTDEQYHLTFTTDGNATQVRYSH